MSLIESAEAFARAKNADINFCKSVVFRLKSIGVNDEQVLCCAFLCHSNSSFDEIHARFGREIATCVTDRKSTRLNSSHIQKSRMPSSA